MFICKNNNSQSRLNSALVPSNPPAGGEVGFTLIELLVVIVIIGIIATMTTIALTSSRANARDARRISDLKQIATALELYQADNNSYPTYITGGNALVNPSDASKVYMKKIPSDPSTNTSYSYYGSTSRFTLRTSIEKAVDNIPVGPVIITSGGGVKQAVNSDNNFLGPDLTFGALIGHWALDGNTTVGATVNDLSGNNKTGTAIETSLTVGKHGEAQGAYYFDGLNARVNIPSLGTVTRYTVSMWVNQLVPSSTSYPYFSVSGATLRFGLYDTNNRNNVRWRFADGTYSTIYLSGNLSLNKWYHLVATYDVDNYVRGYVNGALSQETIASTYYSNTWSSASVAFNLVNGMQYLECQVSDVRIYSRALNGSEIEALYNATKP